MNEKKSDGQVRTKEYWDNKKKLLEAATYFANDNDLDEGEISEHIFDEPHMSVTIEMLEGVEEEEEDEDLEGEEEDEDLN